MFDGNIFTCIQNKSIFFYSTKKNCTLEKRNVLVIQCTIVIVHFIPSNNVFQISSKSWFLKKLILFLLNVNKIYTLEDIVNKLGFTC